MILLSILIPTIPERYKRFTRLYNEIMRQKTEFDTLHHSIGSVEVIINPGEKFLNGGLSIGKKREELVKTASGKYLCFLDDDESIAPNYLESLMRLCIEDNDIITFRAFVRLANMWALVNMDLNNTENEQIHPDGIVSRPPWHMSPVKSHYAKSFPFPDLNNAEDFVWMESVLKCCHTQSHTDKILFCYQHGEHSEADKIPLPPMEMNL